MWMMLIPVALCLAAMVQDLKKREIPDEISLSLLVTGLLATWLNWHTVSLIEALFGAAIGFVVVLPFALRNGIGGGDLKLVSGLGAWLGPVGALHLLFWSALAGMFAAIISGLRGH